MTDRKKPTAGFWIIVALVGVLVAYPLSFGPACWITSRTNFGASAVPIIYRPVTWGLSDEDELGLDAAIQRYAKLGAAKGWIWWPRGTHGEWEWFRAPVPQF